MKKMIYLTRKVQKAVWMKILTKMMIKMTKMTWTMRGALRALKLYRVRLKNRVVKKRNSCHLIQITRRPLNFNTNNTTTDSDRFNNQQAS